MKKNTPETAKKHSHLTLAEREEIAVNLEKGLKQREIATLVNCSPNTVSREIKRNNPPVRVVRYRAQGAA